MIVGKISRYSSISRRKILRNLSNLCVKFMRPLQRKSLNSSVYRMKKILWVLWGKYCESVWGGIRLRNSSVAHRKIIAKFIDWWGNKTTKVISFLFSPLLSIDWLIFYDFKNIPKKCNFFLVKLIYLKNLLWTLIYSYRI